MKSIYASVLLIFNLRCLAEEIRYECPSEIQTSQSFLGELPEGWTSVRENKSHHWLKDVAVFDGPPEELASLIPDNEKNTDLKKTTWTFKKKKTRQIYMSCNYLKTDMIFVKALPIEINHCRVLCSKRNPITALGLICNK